MKATIQFNEPKNGVELHFSEKPSEAVRTVMKEAGWRFSGRSGCWYHRKSDANVKFAQNLVTVLGSAGAPPAVEAPPPRLPAPIAIPAAVPVAFPRRIDLNQPLALKFA